MPKYYEDKEEDGRACAGIREDFKACLLQHDCVVKVTLISGILYYYQPDRSTVPLTTTLIIVVVFMSLTSSQFHTTSLLAVSIMREIIIEL